MEHSTPIVPFTKYSNLIHYHLFWPFQTFFHPKRLYLRSLLELLERIYRRAEKEEKKRKAPRESDRGPKPCPPNPINSEKPAEEKVYT